MREKLFFLREAAKRYMDTTQDGDSSPEKRCHPQHSTYPANSRSGDFVPAPIAHFKCLF